MCREYSVHAWLRVFLVCSFVVAIPLRQGLVLRQSAVIVHRPERSKDMEMVLQFKNHTQFFAEVYGFKDSGYLDDTVSMLLTSPGTSGRS